MEWNKLTEINEAPESGQMLAYTRKKVIFKPYASKTEAADELKNQELLELHMFDDSKEYRAVATRSNRFKNGVIETVANFSEDNEEEIYKEVVWLEEKQGKMTVLNHIEYDENGMASIDNYRLKMGGMSDE